MRLLFLAAALALTATACSPQDDTTSPTPSQTSTVVPLTVDLATKASMTLADLPKGWDGAVAADPHPDHSADPRSGFSYTPADCWMVRDPLRDQAKPATAVQGKFLVRADSPNDDVVVTERIYSWPSSQLPLVQRIAATLAQCTTVTGKSAGEDADFTAVMSRVPVPGLKDSITLRTQSEPGPRSVVYDAYAARGGTLLSINAGNDSFPTDAAFAQFVTKAVTRLDAVVGVK